MFRLNHGSNVVCSRCFLRCARAAAAERGSEALRSDFVVSSKGDADEAEVSVEIPSRAVTLRRKPLPLFELKRKHPPLGPVPHKALTPETLMASSTEAVSTPAIADHPEV